MRISLITPAAAHARSGNRNTATRWARMLRELGHRVEIEQEWSGGRSELMIALHARRSADSIARYAKTFPERPLVVVLTGTDLYRDIQFDHSAQRSLGLATRLVVLQDRALKELASTMRSKTRVIYQSARSIQRVQPLASFYEIVVSGHLRTEKDPFRAAAALGFLPASSRARVTHVGGALSKGMAREARAWMKREPRYRWLEEVPRWRALQILARSRLMIVSSLMEGGANVICEALAAGVPVIASRIGGNVGMLGAAYPGYYAVGNERALARLISQAERDEHYYQALESVCASRAPLVLPEREKAALEALIAELTMRRRVRARAAA
ncbi:MAG TPA: selenoneine biosynthesis selenosugar synthase SenB [Burkholderiales bacterium]|nr:selenoneine biosynthesis selenosugar synthase SenB [Burkholderiales bacterium]